MALILLCGPPLSGKSQLSHSLCSGFDSVLKAIHHGSGNDEEPSCTYVSKSATARAPIDGLFNNIDSYSDGDSYRTEESVQNLITSLTSSQSSSSWLKRITNITIVSEHDSDVLGTSTTSSSSPSATRQSTSMIPQTLTQQNSKLSRARLKSKIERVLDKNTIVIVDAMNYIKGFRYEIWCSAKSCNFLSTGKDSFEDEGMSGVKFGVVYTGCKVGGEGEDEWSGRGVLPVGAEWDERFDAFHSWTIPKVDSDNGGGCDTEKCSNENCKCSTSTSSQPKALDAAHPKLLISSLRYRFEIPNAKRDRWERPLFYAGSVFDAVNEINNVDVLKNNASASAESDKGNAYNAGSSGSGSGNGNDVVYSDFNRTVKDYDNKGSAFDQSGANDRVNPYGGSSSSAGVILPVGKSESGGSSFKKGKQKKKKKNAVAISANDRTAEDSMNANYTSDRLMSLNISDDYDHMRYKNNDSNEDDNVTTTQTIYETQSNSNSNSNSMGSQYAAQSALVKERVLRQNATKGRETAVPTLLSVGANANGGYYDEDSIAYGKLGKLALLVTNLTSSLIYTILTLKTNTLKANPSTAFVVPARSELLGFVDSVVGFVVARVSEGVYEEGSGGGRVRIYDCDSDSSDSVGAGDDDDTVGEVRVEAIAIRTRNRDHYDDDPTPSSSSSSALGIIINDHFNLPRRLTLTELQSLKNTYMKTIMTSPPNEYVILATKLRNNSNTTTTSTTIKSERTGTNDGENNSSYTKHSPKTTTTTTNIVYTKEQRKLRAVVEKGFMEYVKEMTCDRFLTAAEVAVFGE